MLRQTFVHIPGIGAATERSLWQSGISCWDDFLARPDGAPFSEKRMRDIRPQVEESVKRLGDSDHGYFARTLPRKELWRAFADFPGKVAYLDIETTGLFHSDDITIIGIFDGKKVATFINGINMGDVGNELAKYSVLVTFNGLRFDLPFIQSRMPQVPLGHLHIDLLYPLRRLGCRGGLKSIERQLGIAREDGLADLTGWDAVRLWNEYKRGSDAALQTLVRYNAADIVNLERLMEFSYAELKKGLLFSDAASAGKP